MTTTTQIAVAASNITDAVDLHHGDERELLILQLAQQHIQERIAAIGASRMYLNYGGSVERSEE